MNLSAMYEKNEINLKVPNSLTMKKVVEDYKNKTNYEEKNSKKKASLN
jgi:hypothetical protein